MRKIISFIVALGLTAVPSPGVAMIQTGAAPDERIIEWLGSPIAAVRAAAVAHVLRETSAATRSAVLEQALVHELTRVNADFKRRWEASRAGRPLGGDFPAEYHFDLIEAVAQSSNPAIIPALAGALGTGRRVQEGLAKFGEQAVSAVLPLARQARETPGEPSEPPSYVVADAVSALALIVHQPRSKLTIQSRTAIIDVARTRLNGRQDTSVIAAACALAVATRDPDLRQRVQQLASHRSQLTAMGVSDDASANLIQKVAARELQKR